MQDRVPVNPGRVLITPENGSAPYYATMTRADNPTQEGTPLNKASLLKDATAALFGLGTDAVPDDALKAIKELIDAGVKMETGSYGGTGTYGKSNPNRLTFSFVPKLIFMSSKAETPTDSNTAVCWGLIDLNAMKCCLMGDYSTNSASNVTISGTTVNWYSTRNASYQFNLKATYRYTAIG